MEDIKKLRISFFLNLALTFFALGSLLKSLQTGELYRIIFALTASVGFTIYTIVLLMKLLNRKG